MKRRTFFLTGIAAAVLAGRGAAQPLTLEVYKSPTCGCCNAWIDHMAQAGFPVEAKNVDQETLWTLKTRSGITPELGACHTAFIDGYVVEGHVPAADVQRLLTERPEAFGLTVPGMPVGSPGMEMGSQRDAYDTLLVLPDGASQIFERHNQA